MNRICKVVKRHDTSVANAYKYRRWVYRVVECTPEQKGYLNERGVVQVWESDFCTYASKRPGTKDYEQRAEAERIAAEGNARLALGLDVDTPPAVLADYIAEKV